ncbi:hypothetical protein PsorP6_015781 [Peronosclerospora sorghi]|uniref:Uncharacterized protein n=1 Tax=Peronosclerospora sorghi TaxID=230839 RepID=A0ACC0WNB5_9STRA|nr:hypothetical protein PsorP6_015781 [Peronosclerospora sorghi]
MQLLVRRVCSPLLVGAASSTILPLSSSLKLYSSSSSGAKPSVLDGPEGIMQFAKRSRDRASSQMNRYLEHSVFPPSNWMIQNYLLFTKLQLPTNTEIDAVEFLEGARFACDLAVNTMYSSEFVNFATGAISESPAAEKMKSGLSEACYEAFLFAMKQTSERGNRFTLKQLDINGVYLYDVMWDRMSLAEMKQEKALEAYNRAQVAELEHQIDRKKENGEAIASKANKTVTGYPTANIFPEDHTNMVERLQLDVLLESVEHLEIVTANAVDQVLKKKLSAVWRFESLVTQPDDVDWRIISVS